jgi:hypothetical protein
MRLGKALKSPLTGKGYNCRQFILKIARTAAERVIVVSMGASPAVAIFYWKKFSFHCSTIRFLQKARVTLSAIKIDQPI